LGIHPKKEKSKEELGFGEQEEETQRSETDISIIDPQVNVDPFPLSPSKDDTPPSNEPQ
jgi:hypothetical protein